MASLALSVPPEHRRPRLTLYRYVALESLRPTLIALIGLTAVVLTRDLMEFSVLVVNRGIALSTVLNMALCKAIPVAALMFPFSVLLGSLVALGRMGADREILALEASGVAASRLLWPVVAFAGAMTVVALYLSVVAAPWANRTLGGILERVAQEKPWANIRQGAISRFGGWQLEAREVSPAGDQLEGVLLWMPDIGETVFAKSASLATNADGAIDIQLLQGSVVLSPEEGAQELRFDALTATLPESDRVVTLSENDQLDGLPVRELAGRIDGYEPTPRQPIAPASMKLQRRFALPLAAIAFGFLTVPMLLSRTNFSRAGGGVMGMACIVVYYGLVHFGEGLIQSRTLDVAWGVWLPNAVIAFTAIVLLLRVRRGGVMGHAFDRPQRSERRFTVRSRERELRPRRMPLPRYVAGRFLQLTALSFGVLLVAYLLIDVMERFEWFARFGATGLEAIRFYGARIPLLASRVIPMSLLVGTSLTVSLLAVEGELIGMRACGIPAPRALLPALILSAVVVPIYFAWNNVLVPRTNQLADTLKESEIKGRFRLLANRRSSRVWYRAGSQVLEAERFDTERGVADDLTIYEIGDDGLPVSRVDATSARHVGRGVWRLVEPVRIEIAGHAVKRVPARRFANLGETVRAEVDTMHFSVFELAEEIGELQSDEIDTTTLEVDYFAKIAEPLACIVLPAVVLFFAVGGPPFPGPAQTLLASGVLAVAYVLATGVSASLGYGGTISPRIAGWGPILFFTILAAYFGQRLWRRL